MKRLLIYIALKAAVLYGLYRYLRWVSNQPKLPGYATRPRPKTYF